jgi:hypothetical protein
VCVRAVRACFGALAFRDTHEHRHLVDDVGGVGHLAHARRGHDAAAVERLAEHDVAGADDLHGRLARV